ncbi:MAG: CBS domain-containing protein, partial [Chloroflexota bacterium]|nr:CBS domain-containing protein [Chloroflexota bacterium]
MKVILTHEHADFDALASLLGAWKLYPDAVPVLPRRLNRNVRRFLTLYGEELPFVQPGELSRQPIEQAIVVDTQTFISPKGMGPHTQVRIIDHHPLSRELPSNMTYSGEEIGATTTLLVEQIGEAGFHLSSIEATLLLLGIYEDTGDLSYPTTTPRDVRCAAWLMENGASLSVVNDFLRHPLTEAQRQLYAQLERNSQTYDLSGRSIVVAAASASGYTEAVSTLAHKLRDLLEPDALFLLVKLDDRIQLVARSTGEAMNVAEVAARFGGGGHSHAAAAAIHGQRLEEVHSKLLDLLPLYVKPAVMVRQIMSYGVHTLSPDTTVAEAEEAMRRYGHEGFPVAKEGHIVGLLTRREIDKAIHHGLRDAPIRLFMHKGKIEIPPDDPVERLQQVMMEYDLGQVPVVEEGRIVGIVTRTDLIKLWATPPRRPRAEEIARAMERTLPSSLAEVLKEASNTASEMGFHLYVVGGFVRDLLLRAANLDLDLVVEGDA